MEFRNPDPGRIPADLSAPLLTACRAVQRAGGRAWLVGGTVRDLALAGGAPARDLDLEVFGLAADALQEALAGEFKLDLVGASFGILKLKGAPIDVGLPRRETKVGEGHRGFTIDADPDLPLPAAAARRDYTINAVYLDPLTGELADPHDGLGDLRAGVLRHTSPAFIEDPLRVLRGMQLCARFGLHAADETIALCRTIGLEGLAPERILEEWKKLVLLGEMPSLGLEFLRQTRWLRHFPELAALVGVEQDPKWHPEGDAWAHTLHCLNAFAAERVGNEREDLVVGLAVLCHDLGKPGTTARASDDRIRSIGHEAAGVAAMRQMLDRMAASPRLINEIAPLVAEHMRPLQLFEANASDAAVRRLAVRVGRIDRLIRVARADQQGRPPRPVDEFPAGEWLAQRARALGVESAAPGPLVLGRHLMDLGETEGPHFKAILDRLYDEQVEGKFSTVEEGIERARNLLDGRR